MKYNNVQTLVEQYAKDTFASLNIQLAYENAEFNPTLYTKYVQMTVRFGDSFQRAVENCYRVVGILLLDIKTRPGTGKVESLTLADQLAPFFVKKILVATPPLTAPVVQFMVPELVKGANESNGWMVDHYSCPFYFNVEF
jgi:hypothetical protein